MTRCRIDSRQHTSTQNLPHTPFGHTHNDATHLELLNVDVRQPLVRQDDGQPLPGYRPTRIQQGVGLGLCMVGGRWSQVRGVCGRSGSTTDPPCAWAPHDRSTSSVPCSLRTPLEAYPGRPALSHLTHQSTYRAVAALPSPKASKARANRTARSRIILICFLACCVNWVGAWGFADWCGGDRSIGSTLTIRERGRSRQVPPRSPTRFGRGAQIPALTWRMRCTDCGSCG